MKQTKNYLLNLMEAADALSAKPLNENSEKIDAALLAQKNSFDTELLTQQRVIAGKLMMATGTYTGNGTRSVTIQTPRFKPKVMLVRKKYSGWISAASDHWWIGQNIDTTYTITAASDDPPYSYEPGELFETTIKATITFKVQMGELKWSIPSIPSEYYDVLYDNGPAAINNSDRVEYEWIAFGTAEE